MPREDDCLDFQTQTPVTVIQFLLHSGPMNGPVSISSRNPFWVQHRLGVGVKKNETLQSWLGFQLSEGLRQLLVSLSPHQLSTRAHDMLCSSGDTGDKHELHHRRAVVWKSFSLCAFAHRKVTSSKIGPTEALGAKGESHLSAHRPWVDISQTRSFWRLNPKWSVNDLGFSKVCSESRFL